MALIYKIEDKTIWQEAQISGFYHGAPIDLSDGFIHFSSGDQARKTAELYFAARENLIIASVDTSKLDSNLKWEISRDGAPFPHYYGVLPMNTVVKTFDLPLDKNGIHIFPDEIA